MTLTFLSFNLLEGEEGDNTDNNAEDVVTAADKDDDNNDDDNNNNNNNNNNGATMPPKVKPKAAGATKTAEKKTKKADEIALLPAPNVGRVGMTEFM